MLFLYVVVFNQFYNISKFQLIFFPWFDNHRGLKDPGIEPMVWKYTSPNQAILCGPRTETFFMRMYNTAVFWRVLISDGNLEYVAHAWMTFRIKKYPICDCTRSNRMPYTDKKNWDFSWRTECAHISDLPSHISTFVFCKVQEKKKIVFFLASCCDVYLSMFEFLCYVYIQKLAKFYVPSGI